MFLLAFLAIDINIDPTFADWGGLQLTWHGLFTAIGIIAGVSLSVALAKRDGIPSEIAQEIALVGVPSAIVGARLFYVFEHWDRFSGSNIPDIVLKINDGGITLYGGLLGGVLGGLVYSLWRRWPIAIALDAAAPGMLLGQALGRVGDLINGEHKADPSDLPWAVRYTHPNTLGDFGVAVHPTAGGYELLGDLLILAICVFVLMRVVKVPGWVFCSYVAMYGVMRFFLSYTRTDEQTIGSVPVPQLVSGILLGIAVIAAGILYRYPGPITREYAERVWPGRDDDAPPADATPA
ncbi:MAG: prolipoprotein diacylglyceryl transferase [Chloroflexi bacterium]|nr:prolipoprotein diacylglyceryl transferase [Chloroflexota bacterium]